MPYSLLLDSEWDITLDSAGNIAIASGAYAIAQEVANAVRLFKNDAYFDQQKGIPHFELELGEFPVLALLRSRIIEAALAVEGVAEAAIVFLSFENRMLTGELSLLTSEGVSVGITI